MALWKGWLVAQSVFLACGGAVAVTPDQTGAGGDPGSGGSGAPAIGGAGSASLAGAGGVDLGAAGAGAASSGGAAGFVGSVGGTAGASDDDAGQAGTGSSPASCDPPFDTLAEWDFVQPADASAACPATAPASDHERALVVSFDVDEAGGGPLPFVSRSRLRYFERQEPCESVLRVGARERHASLVVGEQVQISSRLSGSEGGTWSTLLVEDAVGTPVLAVLRGATPISLDADLLQSLHMSSVPTPACVGPASGGLAARLSRQSETCSIAPYGQSCCDLWGTGFAVRMRGASKVGTTRVADFLLSAIARLPPGGSCSTQP